MNYETRANPDFPNACNRFSMRGSLPAPAQREPTQPVLSTESVDKTVGERVASKPNLPSSAAFHSLSNFQTSKLAIDQSAVGSAPHDSALPRSVARSVPEMRML
jgi:hypothetical protein